MCLAARPCRQKRCLECEKIFFTCLKHGSIPFCSKECRKRARKKACKQAQKRYRDKPEVKELRKRQARGFRKARKMAFLAFGQVSMGDHNRPEPAAPVEEVSEPTQKPSMLVGEGSERVCNASKSNFPIVRCARCSEEFLAWIVQGCWTTKSRTRFFRGHKEVPP